jgi:5'-3' exonuclease
MIIVDFNQVVLSNLMMSLGNHTNAQIEENMVRHMVLNALRAFKVKFGDEFGELVVACDNTNVWRKKEFPYYKANRKKSQEKSELDWKGIFECLNKIRQELKDNFPYRIIDVESAEADDVIATLVKYKHDEQNILIMSGDKDFIQLHKYDGVQQYDPVRKRKIAHDNPKRYLIEHILKGDSGDGIPNVLSPDNCFVVGERQTPMTAKKIAQYLTSDPSTIEDPIVLRNYHRNQQLIDLSFVPSYIEDKVLEQYDTQKGKDRSKLMNYFINNKLKNLMEHMSEF